MEDKKIALVTGANKGIGLEIVRQLAAAGLTVILGARNFEAGKTAAAQIGHNIRPLRLDLANPELIEAAAAVINEEFGRLDVLVNNAAIVDPHDGPPSSVDVEALRRVMETNFYGTLAITQAMLPLIRKAPAGRIVNLSSGLASLQLNGDPNWSFAPYKYLGYNMSKAALNMITVQLANELRDTPIKVNAVSPGFIATDMNANQGTGTVQQGAAEPVRLALLGPDGPTGGYFEAGERLPW
jgi:NAD(P)-dependent dehydrogenase (short-subunit alcohol dehydrogenase family)